MIRFIRRWKWTISAALLFAAALAVMIVQGKWLEAVIILAAGAVRIWIAVRRARR